MEKIKEKISQVQREIETVVSLFYQEKNQEAYPKTNLLLSDLIELNGMVVEAIRAGKSISFEEEQFNATLMEAMKALQQKDYVLFSDILQYDIAEQINEWVN